MTCEGKMVKRIVKLYPPAGNPLEFILLVDEDGDIPLTIFSDRIQLLDQNGVMVQSTLPFVIESYFEILR